MKDLQDFFEKNGFIVHPGQEGFELEMWTNGGVDMVIYLSPFTADEFIKYVDEFDIDEVINNHLQDKMYRNSFSIRDSLTDFESFEKKLRIIAKKLKRKLNEQTIRNSKAVLGKKRRTI